VIVAVARSELDLTAPGEIALAQEAAQLAGRLPDLLMQSRLIANTIAHGIHGRRRAGAGETFWQFRHFQSGEPARRVDWRRSARDDHLYVRETEWEASHTVWISVDRSPSMYFRSRLSQVRKIERAIVTALALTDLLVRGGERVGLVGLMRPSARRTAAEQAADCFARQPLIDDDALPQPETFERFSEFIHIGDLLSPLDQAEAALTAIAARRVHGHVVQVMDPAEETFPFSGRTEFRDPEGGSRFIAGRAESVREAFQARMADRRDRMRRLSERLGWTNLVHHTDRPAQELVLALHMRLSMAGGYAQGQ
jgi:uncharacterized protein (DUF58 family)